MLKNGTACCLKLDLLNKILGQEKDFLKYYVWEKLKIATEIWFNQHLIPTDAMQFEWLVCACNKGDDAANVQLINSMIKKGIDAFRDPANRTQINPRFGAEFPKK